MTAAGQRRLVRACFFASGAAALAYEVVVQRLLASVAGQSSRAVALVLAGTMAGMALGALAAARIADRVARPLRAYGIVEGLVAAYALATPAIVAGVARAAGPGATVAIQALAGAAALLPATALMGATLPLLARHAALAGAGRAEVAALYAINTAGAVAGTLAAGLWAIPAAGLRGTLVGAAAASAVACVAALATSSLSPRAAGGGGRGEGGAAERAASSGEGGPRAATVAIAAAAGAGAAVMAGEVAWTRVLALVLGSSTYAFTAMLATHLLAIAAGASVAARLARRGRASLLSFGLLQAGAGVATLAVLPLVPELPALVLEAYARVGLSHAATLAVQLAVSFGVVVGPALLASAGLPVLFAALGDRAERAGRDVGLATAASTAGAVLGALAAGFGGIERLGLQGTLRGTAAVSLLSGVAALAVAPSPRRRAAVALALGVPVAAALAALPAWDPRVLVAGASIYAPEYVHGGSPRSALEESVASHAILFHEDGRGATVAVTRSGDVTSLSVNGKTDASDGEDMPTQLLLGHLPALLHGEPRRALVVGLGSGVTAGALAAHPLAGIDVAELEPAVVRASRFFDAASRAPLDDPRVRVLVDDARHVIAGRGPAYDIITAEPSNPWIAGVGSLFTLEFYEAARARLAPGGVMLQWIHAYALAVDDLRLVARTFLRAFPEATLWRGGRGDLFLVATDRPLRLDLSSIGRRLAALPVVRDDLSRALGDVETLPWLWVLGPGDLRAFAGDGPLNTDDHPRLEFSAPRSLHRRSPDANLGAIRAFRSAELPPVTGLDLATARSPASRLQIARVFQQQGAREDALEQLQRIGDPGALPIPLRIERASLLAELARLDLALPDLLALEPLAPEDPRVARYLNLARNLPALAGAPR